MQQETLYAIVPRILYLKFISPLTSQHLSLQYGALLRFYWSAYFLSSYYLKRNILYQSSYSSVFNFRFTKQALSKVGELTEITILNDKGYKSVRMGRKRIVYWALGRPRAFAGAAHNFTPSTPANSPYYRISFFSSFFYCSF